MIAKRAESTEMREIPVYKEILEPLRVKAPELIWSLEDESSAFMLFEDVGPVTVEDEPRPANFR